MNSYYILALPYPSSNNIKNQIIQSTNEHYFKQEDKSTQTENSDPDEGLVAYEYLNFGVLIKE